VNNFKQDFKQLIVLNSQLQSTQFQLYTAALNKKGHNVAFLFKIDINVDRSSFIHFQSVSSHNFHSKDFKASSFAIPNNVSMFQNLLPGIFIQNW